MTLIADLTVWRNASNREWGKCVKRVVIYQPTSECVACRTTKLQFDRLGILYDVVDADEGIVNSLRSQGFTGFPVVKVDCGDGATWQWSGYRHTDIQKLAQLFG